MKITIVRPKDTVKVQIMYDRNTEKYCFVNLTKGHVCRCRFNTPDDALIDLMDQKRQGKVLEWYFDHQE